MTGLIPALIKTAYKREPVFAHSKIVFTIGENTFKEKLGNNFLKLALINNSITPKDLEVFKDTNNTAMFRGGATYADAITFGAEKPDKKLLEEFSKVRGKKVIPFKGWDTDLTEYLDLYNDLAGK
jgi:starch synthase